MADIKLTRLKINGKAYRTIMRSPLMAARMLAEANRIRSRAASMYGAKNYKVRKKIQKVSAKAYVYTADRYAMRSNQAHNTLRKASGGK